MIFGYARVSTSDQNLNLQIDQLKKYGCDQIIEETASGKNKDRPALNNLLEKLRKGDKIVIYKLDRISRSTKHLIELSEFLDQNGVDLVSINDHIDTTSAIGKFFFRVLASISELERDIISERTKAGLQAARSRGRKGGRPKADEIKIRYALDLYNSKSYTVSEIEILTGVSKSTLYRNVKQLEKI